MNPRTLKAKLLALRKVIPREIIKVEVEVFSWEFEEIVTHLIVPITYQNHERLKALTSFTYMYPFGVELTLKIKIEK